MSEGEWNAIITVGIFVGLAILIYLFVNPSKEDEERSREKERLDKEHIIEMTRLEKERRRLAERERTETREVVKHPKTPPGRGKVVKPKPW